MTELLAILTNTRRIKAILKVLTLDEARFIRDKVSAAVAQLEEDEHKSIQAEAERKEKIKQHIEKAAELGLTANDLAQLSSGNVNVRSTSKSPVAAKYEWFIGSERGTWSGRGRMPVELRTRIEQGAALESFLIRS